MCSLDPETKKHSVDVYPESQYIGTIAMREEEGVSRHLSISIPAMSR
jgi:hypothetical protein